MRQLLRRLEEAAPAPGSKEWLSGVRKWWGKWAKDVERIAKIRDKQDRKVVLSWFADGKKFILAMIDVLVRRANMVSGFDVGMIAARGDAYASGKGRLEVPKVYTADGKRAKYEPSELVHPYLQSAFSTLETMQDMESDRWNEAQDPRSGSMWGTTNDLDVWQAFMETLPYDIRGIDADVQAALRKFSAEVKIMPGREKVITKAIPLDYDIGGVKVLTDPGSLQDLGRLSGLEAQSDSDSTRIDNITAEYVLDGLRSAQRALKQRGFGKLWYGRIFVIPPSRATSFRTKKTGTPSKSAGSYSANSNNIVLHPHPAWKAREVMEVTVHELGHRYWYKFMKAGARARFAAWFDPRTKKIQDRDGPQADFVPAPTTYGAESPVEEFAEVFAAYVLGKYEGITLTGPQKARFEALALWSAAQSEAVHGRSHGMGIRKLVERIEQVMIEWDGYDDTRTDVEALARNIVVLEPVLYNVTLLIRNNAEDAAVNAMKHARSANLSAKLNKQDQLADDILRRSEEVHDAYQTFIKAWQAARKPDAAPKELRAVVPSYSDLRTRLLKLKETIAGKPNKKKRAR